MNLIRHSGMGSTSKKFAGRQQDMINKYPQYEKEIEFFIQNDPSGNLKYLEWELKVLASGQALEQEISEVIKLFHKFSHKLDKRDINQYSPQEIGGLRDMLFELAKERVTTKEVPEDDEVLNSVLSKEIASGSKLVYDSKKYSVYLISNKAASCSIGAGTRWCISVKEHGWYENYDANNVVFFFILSKIKNVDKIAVAVQRDANNSVNAIEYFDQNDTMFTNLSSKIKGGDCAKIEEIIKSIAPQQPKGIGAKIKSDEASLEEVLKYIDIAKSQTESAQEMMFRNIENSTVTLPSSVLTSLLQFKTAPAVLFGLKIIRKLKEKEE